MIEAILAAWRRLSPNQLRWITIGVGIAFVIALLLSDFLANLSAGFAFALDSAHLRLFGLETPCPPREPGKLTSCFGTRTSYVVNVSVKLLAILAMVIAGLLLYAASKRQPDAAG